jgi:hypothetical protein
MVAEVDFLQTGIAERTWPRVMRARQILTIMEDRIRREYHSGWPTRLREVQRAVGDHENVWKPSEDVLDFMKPYL